VKPRTDVSRNREGTDKAKRKVLVHDVLVHVDNYASPTYLRVLPFS